MATVQTPPKATEPVQPTCASVQEAERRMAAESAADHFHPLETISFFRRWPRSFWRNVVYTVIFNMMFAAMFSAIALLSILTSDRPLTMRFLTNSVVNNIVISNVIGFTWWAVMELMDPLLRWVNARQFFVVVLFYAVAGTVIVTLSFFLVSWLPGFGGIRNWLFTPPQLVSGFIISLIISLVITTIWHRRAREVAREIEMAHERERAESAERAATQASLRALQAQIEPHFLFNTLANVTSLIHSKPDDAKKMLEEFIAYLRASLATTREAETTLQKEFNLLQSFLSVLRVRMGGRLKTSFELDDAVSGFRLPPMLLQPLVENAIKHGLEPKMEGGEVSLKASRSGDQIVIVVADTGLGFQNASSNGIGLKNVRERLDMLYNGRATLSIEDNQPSGTRIVIGLPVNA